MGRSEPIRVTDDYKLVYQGGHHNVYCNGIYHIKTDGGFCHEDVDRRRVVGDYIFDCDCSYWRTYNA